MWVAILALHIGKMFAGTGLFMWSIGAFATAPIVQNWAVVSAEKLNPRISAAMNVSAFNLGTSFSSVVGFSQIEVTEEELLIYIKQEGYPDKNYSLLRLRNREFKHLPIISLHFYIPSCHIHMSLLYFINCTFDHIDLWKEQFGTIIKL